MLIAGAFPIQPLELSRLRKPMGIGFRCARRLVGRCDRWQRFCEGGKTYREPGCFAGKHGPRVIHGTGQGDQTHLA